MSTLPCCHLVETVFCSEAATLRCSQEKCFENMQQIYKRTPMPRCNFNKVACWIFSEHLFLRTLLGGCFCLLHTQQTNRAAYLMKRENTAIVQEPHLRDCGWDVTGNIIWVNEHFPEKIANVVHNEY